MFQLKYGGLMMKSTIMASLMLMMKHQSVIGNTIDNNYTINYSYFITVYCMMMMNGNSLTSITNLFFF